MGKAYLGNDRLQMVAFHNTAIGKALVDLDGRWLEVNDALASMLEYPKEELLGLTFQQVTHPDDLEADLLLVQQLLAGARATYQVEKRYVRKNGTVAWASLFVALVQDEDNQPKCFIVEIVDMTRQKLAEVDRQLFFNLSPDLPAIANVKGYLVEVSDAWTTTLGWSAAELTSRPYIDFVHPGDRERTLAEMRKLYEGTPAKGFRNRYVTKDGSYRWLEWSAPTVHEGRCFCMARDVSREFEAEQMRVLQEEKIRLLVQNTGDGFIGMDQAGRITEWNRQAEKMLGWTAQEAIGKDMATLVAPHRYRSRHEQGVANFIETGKANIVNKRVELPVLTKAGKEMLVEMTVGAIHHGDEYYFGTFIRDIAHRKELEAQLHYQATRDYLTGLPNRFELMSRLERALRREARTGEDEHVALLFIDLDGFKQVNDVLGHDAGDNVLKAFAEKLRHLVRNEIDTVARLAGDEFVVILEDVSRERAMQVAQDVLLAGSEGLADARGDCELSASVGLAFHMHEEQAEDFLSRADAAMYAAKQAGKNKAAIEFGRGREPMVFERTAH